VRGLKPRLFWPSDAALKGRSSTVSSVAPAEIDKLGRNSWIFGSTCRRNRRVGCGGIPGFSVARADGIDGWLCRNSWISEVMGLRAILLNVLFKFQLRHFNVMGAASGCFMGVPVRLASR
jgi:hypothetical protein